MTLFAHGFASMLAGCFWVKTKELNFLNTQEVSHLFLLFVLGILPDLPLALLVLTRRYNPKIHFHHTWITHTPIFWLLLAMVVYLWISKPFAELLLLGTWLHLAMDWYGAGDGIMFLYPFSHHQFGVLLSGVHGKEGFQIYIRQWYFFLLETLVILSGILYLIFLIFSSSIK